MGQLCIELAKRHSSISDVGMGANCEIGEAANETLVINEDFIIANIRN